MKLFRAVTSTKQEVEINNIYHINEFVSPEIQVINLC